MAKLSAGILLYRRDGDGTVEAFLVHPGGPFWARKDAGAWSIPAGLVEGGETSPPPAASSPRRWGRSRGRPRPARRNPPGQRQDRHRLRPRRRFRPGGGRPNTIEIDWLPRTGRRMTIPEVDRAGWFGLDAAAEKLIPGQRPFLDALARLLDAAPA